MSKRNDEILSEVFSAAGRFILEGGEPPSLSGDPEQVRAIRRATLASRRFYEALCNETATIDAVNVMMEERRRAASEFKRVLGSDWRF
jgi:hypothetical protein